MGMNITPLTRPEVQLTTSNLVVDSDLSMNNYNLQANNVQVDGSIVRVVECIPSETVYYRVYGATNSVNEIFVLNYLPSTYYSGTIIAWSGAVSVGSIYFYNVDGTITKHNLSPTKQEFTIPDKTIACMIGTINHHAYAGFTTNYLPLPTPPNAP